MSKKRAPVLDAKEIRRLNLLLKRKTKNLDYTLTLGYMAPSNKFRNIRSANGDGTFSDSRKEARIDAEYQTLLRCGQLKKVERKKRFPLVVEGVKICDYECDWVVTDKKGETAVIDAKGFKTPVYKIKKKLMKALYGIDIIER
ncbi:MAG: DUF1064 domain-containing protein [Sedimentisphaerales bacterium]